MLTIEKCDHANFEACHLAIRHSVLANPSGHLMLFRYSKNFAHHTRRVSSDKKSANSDMPRWLIGLGKQAVCSQVARPTPNAPCNLPTAAAPGPGGRAARTCKPIPCSETPEIHNWLTKLNA